MSTTNYIPAFITLAAVGAALIMRSKRKSNNPSLITNPDLDMSTTDPYLPRGYRNNNPLNLIKTNISWLGKVKNNTDSRFEQFENLVYGYRANLMNMRTKIRKGYNTIGKLISVWAPENENDTTKYINDVVSLLNKTFGAYATPFDTLRTTDKNRICQLAYVMSIVENGLWTQETLPSQRRNIKETFNLPNMEIITEAWNLL